MALHIWQAARGVGACDQARAAAAPAAPTPAQRAAAASTYARAAPTWRAEHAPGASALATRTRGHGRREKDARAADCKGLLWLSHAQCAMAPAISHERGLAQVANRKPKLGAFTCGGFSYCTAQRLSHSDYTCILERPDSIVLPRSTSSRSCPGLGPETPSVQGGALATWALPARCAIYSQPLYVAARSHVSRYMGMVMIYD